MGGSGSYRLTMALAVVTCALAPAYTVRFHIGPIPTTLLETALLVTVAAYVIESFRFRTWPNWRSPLTVPAILFFAVGAISVVVAPDRRAAIGLYRAYIIEPILFGLVLSNVVATASRAAAVIAGLAAGAVVAGLANSTLVLVALSHRDYDVLNAPPVVIYNTANAVALYLVPLIAMAGALILHWPSRRGRVAASVFVVIGVSCVLLSFSRGGYLALAALAVGLALSHRRRWLLLLAGVVLGIIVLQVPAIGHRVRGEIDLSDPHNTLVGRFHLWSAALQMLRDHPIFGAGLSGFSTVLAPYWNPTHTDRFTYPHNILLNFWTETGLAGVVAFGWIVVRGFIRTWQRWRNSLPGWRAIHLGVLLALVVVLVHGLVDVPYWKNDLSLEFWALLSLSFAESTSRRTSGSTTARLQA